MSLTTTSVTLVCQDQRQPINNKIEDGQIYGEPQDDLKEFFDNNSEHQTTFFDIVLFYKNNKADYPIIWVYAQNISDVLSGLFTPKINTQKRPLCKKCEEKNKKGILLVNSVLYLTSFTMLINKYLFFVVTNMKP